MAKQLLCLWCKTPMKVAYIREGKKWRRIAWACPRCGQVEKAMFHEFRPKRKAKPLYGTKPSPKDMCAFQKQNPEALIRK